MSDQRPVSREIVDRLASRLDRERLAREQAERIAQESLSRLARQAEETASYARQLKEALAESEVASRMRQEVVNAAAHVLRTPLTSLMLRLEAAMKRVDERTAPGVEAALESARHLNRVVNDLIRVSQVDGGLLVYDPTIVDLEAWAERHPLLDVVPSDGGDMNALTDVGVLDEIIELLHKESGLGQRVRARLERREGAVMLHLVPSVAETRDAGEKQSLGLGTYLAEQLARASGGKLSRSPDALGRETWHLRVPTIDAP